ncbi:putative MFS-type transporter [Yarrowia sp. C11]|nr:putative MFS-type transporter [Yarrowia sp. C11]KAG5358744.1 putative MFS-type transporter [Yarrowia sp. E02]
MSHEPPGTTILETETSDAIILHPTPTADPNEPLNWSSLRKHTNFFIVCFFTLMAFTASCVSTVFWTPQNEELGWTLDELNNGYALSVAGLGLGCPLMIPFAEKFGKRPVYLFSSALALACSAWSSKMTTVGELYGANLLQGMATSVTETIIQMTVADLYFVHQRGTCNGIYMVVVDIGNFLIMVPAGYITMNLGWRWVYGIIAIIFGVQFLSTIVLFEETKYQPGAETLVGVGEGLEGSQDDEKDLKYTSSESKTSDLSSDKVHDYSETPSRHTYTPNPLSKRLALVTYTPGSWKEFGRKMYTPFITLFAYPIVTFVAIQYGFMLTWLAMAATTVASAFAEPPYNFSSAAIGNVNIAPFIGMALGSIYGGWFNDKMIIWMARRNGGVYEPEMRLWSLIPANITLTIGLLLFGIPTAHGVHWMVPTLGFAIIMFGFGSSGAIVLTYLLDSYKNIVADAFIGVIVVRNAFGMIMVFAQTPWIEKVGLQNVYITVACISLIPLGLTIPLIKYGKALRRKSEARYLRESMRR